MKTKTKGVIKKTGGRVVKNNKQKKRQQKHLSKNIYFETILMIIFIPLVSFFILTVFQRPSDSLRSGDSMISYINNNEKNVEILTEKNIYEMDDKIILSIINNSQEAIYFEPCEYLNRFEKNINGAWKAEKIIVENKTYDNRAFRKEENITDCDINLPKSGAGIYRAVVEIYYDCQIPGREMCADSKVFYSNEFEVREVGKTYPIK